VISVIFVTAVLGAGAVLGIPAAVHPSARHLSLTAKGALAWSTGTLILAIILTVLSTIALPWEPWWILLACLAALAVSWRAVRTSRAVEHVRAIPTRFDSTLTTLCVALIAGGGLFAFVFGLATSADLSYFWGVKAIHFALDRGIDFELLRQPHMIHLHPNYPPLWPVVLAWGGLIATSFPWLVVPSLTWICLTAAAAIIYSVVDSELGPRSAGLVTCLWYAVLMVMTVTSFSGGNADGPLVMFLSIALVVILTEARAEPRPLRWLAAISLAGAVFTKSEGVVAVALITAGTAARDFVWRRPAFVRQTVLLITPAASLIILWVVARAVHGIPLTDPIRETAFNVRLDHLGVIARVCLRLLSSPVVATGCLVPLATVFVVGGNGLTRSLPGIVTTFGILAFAVGYYLHAQGDPVELIVWTFPRLILPAMSAWILGLGVAALSVLNEPEATTPRNSETTS
jgi:hypothetical protein